MPATMTYFLRVDQINGDATLRGYEGWFPVGSFRWEADGSTGGVVLGLPLTVDVLSITGVVPVEKKAASGVRPDRVELQTYLSDTSGSGWVLKIVLNRPLVTPTRLSWTSQSTATDAYDSRIVARWSFSDYDRAEISSRSRTATGQWTAENRATWIRS